MDVTEYKLNPNPRGVKAGDDQDDIYLTIKIGNGQIGGNKVTSGDELLAKGNLSQPAFLGKAGNLKESLIDIETNVLDVNPFTNNCVITSTFLNQDNDILFTKIDKGEAPLSGVASFKGKYSINILLVLWLVFCVFNQDLAAQNSIEFNDLETPSSPGFMLLDQGPSSIEKPTTPQGLGFSLLGLQQEGAALEFAPFWLTDHPGLTARDMYKNKTPFVSHLSVSIASVQTDVASYLAGGIRTRVFQAYGKTTEAKVDSLHDAIVDALSEGNFNQVEELRNRYENITENPIFLVDIAAAIGGGSDTGSFENLERSRWAAWTTINWRPRGEDFYVTSLARLIKNELYNEYDADANLVDLGIRVNYDISKISISLEYLQRLNTTAEEYDDFRIAAIGSYEISDNIYVTSSFGKNFTEVDNIIALAGINFGFSKNKIKAY